MNLEPQKYLFNSLHDGEINRVSKSDNSIQLVIKIPFLAKQINSKFENVILNLVDAKKFTFLDWNSNEEYLSLSEIEKMKPTILSCTENEDMVEVQVFTLLSGGFLRVLARNILIFDETGNKIERYQLDKILDGFWIFSKRKDSE